MSHGIYPNINPATTSGIDLANLLNTFKDGIASMLKASTRDPNLQPGGFWLDDSLEAAPNYKWTLKQFDGTDDNAILSVNIQTGRVSFTGSDSSFELTKTSADSVGPVLSFLKERIANGGQVLENDVLAQVDTKTTTDTGAKIVNFRFKVISDDNSVAGAAGSYVVLEMINEGSAILSEKIRIRNGNIGIGAVDPTSALHIKSSTGVTSERTEATASGVLETVLKKRIATNGQTLNGDTLYKKSYNTVDQLGDAANGNVEIEVKALEDHTDTAHGTSWSVATKNIGAIVSTIKLLVSDIVYMSLGAATKYLLVGTDVDPIDNVKLHRAASAKLQLVKGNQTTAEGTENNVLAELSARLENFTFAGLPAAGNAGRLVWVTDKLSVYQDTGAAWRLAGGGGGGSSISFNEAANPPVPFVDAQYNSGRLYMAGETQKMVATIKIPAGYPGATQIKAALDIYSPDTSGTVIMRTTCTLIRKNTDIISSVTNQRVSTNAAITMSAGNTNRPIPVEFDLTDASGKVNGVDVSANDILIVELYRVADTAVSDVRVLDKTSEMIIG